LDGTTGALREQCRDHILLPRDLLGAEFAALELLDDPNVALRYLQLLGDLLADGEDGLG